MLNENIRQREPAKRQALDQLRTGKVTDAVDWYRHNDRLVTATTRDEVLDDAVAAWEADLRAGHDAILLAWRRRDVAALNQRARQRASQPAPSPVPSSKHRAASTTPPAIVS